MTKVHLPKRYAVLMVVMLAAFAPASSLDSLVFLGRHNHLELQGLLREFSAGEDWMQTWSIAGTTVPSGSVVRRFQSMDDSVRIDTDTLISGSHRTSFFHTLVHGDFNGDTHRDYVGNGVWIMTGTDSGYSVDSTTGPFITPEFVGDYDGDGFDDVFGVGSGGWKIWWGDSVDPLESVSYLILPAVQTGTDTVSGYRTPYFLDRYAGVTVVGGQTKINRRSGVQQVYHNAWRVNDSELQSHQDTITQDSVLSQVSHVMGIGFDDLYRRIGDSTIVQSDNGRLILDASGLTMVLDSGLAQPDGHIAGFGMDWKQRFLDYDYLLHDSVVTLLVYEADSLKYRLSYVFNYGNVDSGSNMRYCSMFPDVTSDGYLELGITFEDINREYYTNIYDVFGAIPLTSVQDTKDSLGWGDPQIKDGRVFWSNASPGHCIIEASDLSGKILERFISTGQDASHRGVILPSGIDSATILLIRITQNGLQQTFKVLGGGSAR